MILAGCSRNAGVPAADSQEYRDTVSAFYVGLAGLETGEDARALEKLTLAAKMAPGEAASWANLALLAVRQQDFETAFTNADKARALAPSDSHIEALLGLIEAKRGKQAEAIQHLGKAVELDGKNLKAMYALAEETEREGSPGALNLFERVLAQQPENTAVLLDVARLAAKAGDAATLRDTLAKLEAGSKGWPEGAKARLVAMREAGESNPRAAAVQAPFLRNLLARVPAYRQSLNAVKTPAAFVGEPFRKFLNLPAPSSQPAPIDAGLRFTARTLSDGAAWAMVMDTSGKYSIVTLDAKGLRVGASLLPFAPGTVGRNSVVGADLNYDFKTDLVVASGTGVRVFEQGSGMAFTDVTGRAKLPAAVLKGAYSGAWAFDVDLDGDLDIVLSDGSVLRNNADGTFAVIRSFGGVKSVSSFAAADVDGDGDPDVAMVDAGGALHLFRNERLGEYRETPVSLSGKFVAVAAGDVDADGLADFVGLREDGSVARVSREGAAELIAKRAGTSSANLILADFDNNGALDVLAGDRMFLSDGHTFTAVAFPAGLTLTGAADLHGNGRLSLIGATELDSTGTKNYGWQTLQVRAAKTTGDQRFNSFGIGGEIEVRSGLLTQKQVIASPVLHFGLGERTGVDVARIVWPNGSVQAEFDLKAGQTVLAEQRLKGSCPFLFAWNGTSMAFVKDGEPWSPALGLHINAQKVAGIGRTTEWFTVPGEALRARDGYYDLRVTGELWETYYIDHYSLLAVDHPQGTEVFTDERFSVPPPELRVYTVSTPRPFASARDDRGTDVGDVVRAVDGKYLDTFGRGRYQGVTRDHWVELELPADTPRTGPLYLIGSGWMHPTDGTVNVAMGQSSDAPPQGLSIEVPDAKGKWIVARAGLGFLAGRNKTAVLSIGDVFVAGAPRRLRLRTNLEIYWDRLAWAAGAGEAGTRVRRAEMTSAELRYRGFSTIQVANESSPEIPDYNHLEGTAQKWRDLEGYYTRYGDVRELLDKIDDRIVITNAGDEVRMRFAEVPLGAGMRRDFVMVGDGWIKDGDYNSTFSKTVLPLPYHAMKDYTRKPSTLEEDTGYKLHPGDWETFHTRYVTPEWFVKGLF